MWTLQKQVRSGNCLITKHVRSCKKGKQRVCEKKVRRVRKKLDTCTRATEQALKKKDYKAVEKSMRTAFVFMKAHSALKKQIPQKLVILADKNACSCSVCGNIINDCLASYCSRCGQKIDWKD